MDYAAQLERMGITVRNLVHNAPPAVYYERAILRSKGSITSTGALATRSGEKTGRSPKDKRIVRHDESYEDVWWGDVNIALPQEAFPIVRQRALDYLNTRDYLYVVDCFAGWDPKYRIKVRVVCSLAYHALFMQNMLIRPTREELASFGEPDFTIFNAGAFPASPYTVGMSSSTSVSMSFEEGQMVLLGTLYAEIGRAHV